MGLNSKDRKSTRDKANISNPKVNRGCAPLTANRTSADCVQISLGPSIPYIPLGVYHTGRFNAMIKSLISCDHTILLYDIRWSNHWDTLCQYSMLNARSITTTLFNDKNQVNDFHSGKNKHIFLIKIDISQFLQSTFRWLSARLQ